MRKLYLFLPAILFIASCAQGTGEQYLLMKDVTPPKEHSISHCHGYGCINVQTIDIPAETQAKLENLFNSNTGAKNKTAKIERQKIIQAIQIFEEDIGELTQTDTDKGGTFTFMLDKQSKGKQLDCVDESTNTTTYLSYLENQGFIQLHQTVFPVSKQPFFNGSRWWHQSAAIIESESSKKYIVDSWYKDNGEQPYIIPYALWKKGRDASWDKQY